MLCNVFCCGAIYCRCKFESAVIRWILLKVTICCGLFCGCLSTIVDLLWLCFFGSDKITPHVAGLFCAKCGVKCAAKCGACVATCVARICANTNVLWRFSRMNCRRLCRYLCGVSANLAAG